MQLQEPDTALPHGTSGALLFHTVALIVGTFNRPPLSQASESRIVDYCDLASEEIERVKRIVGPLSRVAT
jgi:hypothetical protein